MWHWLFHWLGLDSGSGPIYLAWSGAGGDVAELAIIGAVIGGYRRVNCHVAKCWRIGRQHVEGTPYAVCRRHHPVGKPTHEHILALHRQHKARTEQAAERLHNPEDAP